MYCVSHVQLTADVLRSGRKTLWELGGMELVEERGGKLKGLDGPCALFPTPRIPVDVAQYKDSETYTSGMFTILSPSLSPPASPSHGTSVYKDSHGFADMKNNPPSYKRLATPNTEEGLSV